jgi:hypothetical protein
MSVDFYGIGPRGQFLKLFTILFFKILMELCTLKNVTNCLNTNIYCYLETSGGKISNLYLNVVRFYNTSVN